MYGRIRALWWHSEAWIVVVGNSLFGLVHLVVMWAIEPEQMLLVLGQGAHPIRMPLNQ